MTVREPHRHSNKGFDMLEVKGIVSALITPFDRQGNVVPGELPRLVRKLINAGSHGLFVVSNAGEFFALDEAEKKLILETVMAEVNHEIPIYFGPGAISTREAVRLTKMAESAGVEAVSVISPFFLKFSDDELYEHYRTIAASTRLPVVLYSNPVLTGLKMSTPLVRRLAEIDNIVGVKDSSGDLAVTQSYIEIGSDFSVLAGRDGLILATLLHGGRGAISSLANVCPELIVGIYNNFVDKNIDAALDAQKRVARLRELVGLGTFPSAIKYALQLQGFDVGEGRAPIQPLGEKQRNAMRDFLIEEGLVQGQRKVTV